MFRKQIVIITALLVVIAILSVLFNFWKTYSLILGILIILALILVLYLRRYPEHRLKSRLKQYHKSDNRNKIIMVGSSFFDLWKSAEDEFKPLDVINLGAGGSTIPFWVKHFETAIVPYSPKALIIYAGSNDFNSQKADEAVVFDTLKNLFAIIDRTVPGIPVTYVGICPTIVREASWPKIKRFNARAEELCNELVNYRYIDSEKCILDSQGRLRPDIYKNDKLHFNDKGNAAWGAGIIPPITEFLREV